MKTGPNEPEDAAKVPKLSSVKKPHPYVLYGGIALFYLASVAGVYVWQHQQLQDSHAKLKITDQRVAATQKDLAKVQNDLKEQTKKYDDLRSKNGEQTPPTGQKVSTPTQKDLDLTVLEATTFSSGAHFISIAISLTNNTTSDITISKAAYELKDADNHVYANPQGAYLNLGPRYATLPDTVVSPGETVAGGVTFNITAETILNYTLTIGNESYTVKAKQLGS